MDIAERSKSGVLRPLDTVANGDGVVTDVGVGVFSGDSVAMVMCGLSRRSPGPMARRNRTRSLQSWRVKKKLHYSTLPYICEIFVVNSSPATYYSPTLRPGAWWLAAGERST